MANDIDILNRHKLLIIVDVAGKEQRQIILTFTGDEIEDYMRLIELVGTDKAEETIKEMINKFLR